LFTKLQFRTKFSESEVRKILRDLLQGLAEMARKNVIHRDLKPENIMFRRDGRDVVIVDFGLATIADEKDYLFVRCGTPGYVAPEIINIKDLTTKCQPIADVFSVGAIFYHLLFGRSLFPGKTFNEVLTQNRECDFELAGP
jgi:serine/threonine protein kinase